MATKYHTSALVEAPAETVWEVLTDVERMPEWTPSMTSVRIVSGDGFGVGTKAEIRQPRMSPLTWTVDAVTPLRHFRWSTTTGGVVTHGDHWVKPLANGRHVQVEFEISHTGTLARLVGALTMRRTARYVDVELQGLKQASEAAYAASRRG